MFNNIYCVPDEKKTPQNMFIVYFSCTQVLEMRKKTTKFTPNAALKLAKILKHEIIVNKGN